MPVGKFRGKPKSDIKSRYEIFLSIRKKAFEIDGRAAQIRDPFFIVGLWRSLVARLSGGQEVPSSNLGSPTIFSDYRRMKERSTL
jgi:hypothetical protein